MAILSGLLLENASQEEDEDWESQGSRTYRVAFDVIDDEYYVKNNVGFVINQLHPTAFGQVIKNIKADYIETGVYPDDDATPCSWWSISLDFGGWNPISHTADGDPTLIPVQVSFDTEVYQKACDVAIVGYNADGSPQLGPVVNSANCPFDPPITVDQLRLIMNFTERVTLGGLSPFTLFQYSNYLNSTTWNGFPKFTVRVFPPAVPEPEWSQLLQENFWTLTYRFVYNPDSWIENPIDRGFASKDPSTGEPVQIRGLDGSPVSDPVLLDGSGNVLLNPTPDNIHIFAFQTYFSTDFNSVYPKFSGLYH